MIEPLYVDSPARAVKSRAIATHEADELYDVDLQRFAAVVYTGPKGEHLRRLRFGDKLLRVRDEPESASSRPGTPLPLVCIHGAGMSSVVWMDLLRRFAPGRRVLAPDLPGHGQSERWHDEIHIDGYRDAVGTVCATLQLNRVVLIGHSMGAAVALRCALAWPDRVAGLVLCNGAARLDVADEVLALLARHLPSDSGRDSAFDKGRIDRLPEPFADLCFSPNTPADLRARWQAMLFSSERDVVLADFRACRAFDARLELSRLHVPILLISGEDDLLVPPKQVAETAELLGGSQKNAVHHVIAQSGHFSHLEQPTVYYDLLEKFLKPLI